MNYFLAYYLLSGIMSAIWISGKYSSFYDLVEKIVAKEMQKHFTKTAFIIVAFIIGVVLFPFILINEIYLLVLLVILKLK